MYRGPASGLWSSPNPFSAAPAGSLEVADNVVYTAPTVIEPRRGFEELEDGEFGSADSLANEIFYYGSAIMLAYDFATVAIKEAGESFRAFTWSAVPNGDNRMRFEGAARSVFYNPDDGIRVYDGVGTGETIASAAMEPGITFAFDGGAGTLDAGALVEATVGGIIGEGVSVLGTSAATGSLYMKDFILGTFPNNADLAGLTNFTALVNGATSIALFCTPADVLWWTAGYTVTGATSGALGVISANTVVGAYRVLTLTSVVGTFVSEVVALSSDIGINQPQFAGCPMGTGLLYVPALGADGWQEADTAVAYRFTLCRKDAFGRVVEGPPSGRTIVRNTPYTVAVTGLVRSGGTLVTGTILAQTPTNWQSGDVVTLSPGEANFAAGAKTIVSIGEAAGVTVFTYAEAGANVPSTLAQEFSAPQNPELSCYVQTAIDNVPTTATTSNFIRVYRSVKTLTADDVPDDELYQCYESPFLSLTEIANGVMTFVDVAPESTLEVPLYTNQNSGLTATAANYQPPIAEDITYWQDRMWYLNTTSRHSAMVTLIGVGSPDGLQADDTLTIAPDGLTTITVTAKLAPASPGEFQLFTDGDPGYNVQRTAQSLCQTINGLSSSTVYAFYISSETGQPGKILLESVGFQVFGEDGSFSVYSSRPTPWTPQLPSFTAPLWLALASENNRHAARVYYSKLGQPEAVPLLNYIDIDADNAPALKMAELNYRLIIFKADGVYFIPSGEFGVQKLSDHVLVAPDSVKRLGDAVYFLSDQGLMQVDDSGVRPASVQIDTTLMNLGAPDALEDLRERTVACAYRSARQYLLWTIERDALDAFSADNEQAFVRSDFSNGFTRFTFGVRAAIVDTTTDKLVVAPTDDNRLWVERKTLTAADYADVGDEAIATEIRFNKLTDEMPATMKLAQQVSYLFRENGISTVTATFASEIHPATKTVDLESDGWGAFAWGEVPWGCPVRAILRVQPLPPEVANCCQLSVGFTTEQAGAKFAFLGIDVESTPDTIANHG